MIKCILLLEKSTLADKNLLERIRKNLLGDRTNEQIVWGQTFSISLSYDFKAHKLQQKQNQSILSWMQWSLGLVLYFCFCFSLIHIYPSYKYAYDCMASIPLNVHEPV